MMGLASLLQTSLSKSCSMDGPRLPLRWRVHRPRGGLLRCRDHASLLQGGHACGCNCRACAVEIKGGQVLAPCGRRASTVGMAIKNGTRLIRADPRCSELARM